MVNLKKFKVIWGPS